MIQLLKRRTQMKKKTKDVLFLCQFFSPEYISSATLPFDTAKHLAKKGYKVGVLCGYPKEYWEGGAVPKREIVDDIEIHRVNYVQLDRKSVLGRIVNYFSFVFSMIFNMGEAREYKTVMVYSNPPLLPIVALLCKKICKCKVVFVSYDVYPEMAIRTNAIRNDGTTAKCFRILNKVFFKNADTIVAVSKDMKEFFVDNRNIDKKKIDVIPNWYEDCELEGFEQTHVLDDISFDTFVISYLGNLGTCQDADFIVNLAKYLQNRGKYRFAVAGHGNKMDTLKETIRKENLSNITVLPFLHGADYETVLKRSDMFLVTLVKGLSGLCAPSKTYAYFMSGKPVIASMDEDMEIVEDINEYEAGIATGEADYQKVGDAICELKGDLERLERMGKNARKIFVDKYEKQICLQQYENLLNRLNKGKE